MPSTPCRTHDSGPEPDLDENGSAVTVICAIAGGSGAGKTTLALKLAERLGDRAGHLAIDWYYRDLSHLAPSERKLVNYDHPDSLEFELFAEHLDALEAGRSVAAPVYDFATHTRSSEIVLVEPRAVIISEGIHLLAVEAVRARASLLVFVHASDDLRLERRLRRDVIERGRDEQDVRRQWAETVRPMYDEFVGPSMAYADRIIAEDEDLDVVADEIAKELLAMKAPA